MNKIDKKMTENQKRYNYHKTNNAKNSQGSHSENKRKRQVSSIHNYSSNKSNNRKKSSSSFRSTKTRSNSSKKDETISNNKFNQKQQRKRNLPNKRKNTDQPCYHWMEGKCRNFEFCKFKHYQMSQISFKQNNNINKNELINQQMHNQQKILVQLEQTTLMTAEQLIQMILKPPDNISNTIKISYKNKKAMNKLKNQLYKNQRDKYMNKANKLKQEEKILNELLQNTQKDNKNSNALKIKEKIERIKQEQEEKKQIMSNKPKIVIKTDNEEKEVQNQLIKSEEKQEKKNEQIIIETNEDSDEEIGTSQKKKTDLVFFQSRTKPIKKQSKNPQNTQQQNNTSQSNYQQQQISHSSQQKQLNSSQNFLQLLSNTPEQNPLTQQSKTYIEQKDNMLDTQQLDQQIIQDMQWSQNIKSPFMQWKQTRDGTNKQNIDPSSFENTNKSPSFTQNQSEILEFVQQSNKKELFDWKQIYKYKAYRNDDLQNFISHQNPKTMEVDKFKTICLAVDYMEDQALTEHYQKYNNDNYKLKKQGKINEILNIFYNKDLLDINTEKYDPIEIQADFLRADVNHDQSHFAKMAQVINRYIQHLLEYIIKIKITTDQQQYQSNILAIIKVLQQLIQYQNYDPHQLIYQANNGSNLIIFYPTWALNWDTGYPEYTKIQQMYYDKNIKNKINK